MVKIWIYWCHPESSWFFHPCMFVLSHSVVSNSLQPHGLGLPGLLGPWDFPKNTGIGCYSLLQGIFPTPDQTWVPCIAGRFFAMWATREALVLYICVSVRVGKNSFIWLWFCFFFFWLFCKHIYFSYLLYFSSNKYSTSSSGKEFNVSSLFCFLEFEG